MKQEIDRQIYHHNINHFKKPKTSRAPFAINPLLEYLGHGATTPEANDFVRNPDHELPRDTPKLAREILDKLRPQHNEPPPANSEITPRDLIAAFTAWREKTSTSPAGTHLGHYKVWLRSYMSNDEANEEEKGEENPHMTAEEYFHIQAKKLNLAISLAHPLKRWKTVHMLLLPKDDDTIPNNRMRPIDSFDAEINLLRQILVSHRTIHQAEQQNTITNNQWGGRKNRQCSCPSRMSYIPHYTPSPGTTVQSRTSMPPSVLTVSPPIQCTSVTAKQDSAQK